MKVCLINPTSPYLENDAAYPPTGLLYVAATLEHLGCDVQVIDLAVHRGFTLIDDDIDLFGITCVTPNVLKVKELVDAMNVSGRSTIPIMIGGAHPTFMPDDTLRIMNDKRVFVVCGEAETVLPLIIHDVKHGTLQRMYCGIPPSPLDVPKPARHLIDWRKYAPGGSSGAAVIYTSRGCPYNCAFCSKTGASYRQFPIERVVEEVVDGIDNGVQYFVFGDDNIGIHPRRLRNLLHSLKSFNIYFRLNMDSRNVRKDILELAYDAGCNEISYGIESGSQTMLDAMNKRNTVENNSRAIILTQDSGIVAKAYLVVNFPGETRETIDETITFINDTHPDKCFLSAFVPLPGSAVFKEPRKYGITWMSDAWDDYFLVGRDGSFRPCFTTEHLTFDRQQEYHALLLDGIRTMQTM